MAHDHEFRNSVPCTIPACHPMDGVDSGSVACVRAPFTSLDAGDLEFFSRLGDRPSLCDEPTPDRGNRERHGEVTLPPLTSATSGAHLEWARFTTGRKPLMSCVIGLEGKPE